MLSVSSRALLDPVCMAIISNATLEAAAVLRGHANSVSAVHAVSGGGGGGAARAYTGDWSGHVCMWDVACLEADSAEADSGGVSTTQVCKRTPTAPSLGWGWFGSDGDGGKYCRSSRALLLLLWVPSLNYGTMARLEPTNLGQPAT